MQDDVRHHRMRTKKNQITEEIMEKYDVTNANEWLMWVHLAMTICLCRIYGWLSMPSYTKRKKTMHFVRGEEKHACLQ